MDLNAITFALVFAERKMLQLGLGGYICAEGGLAPVLLWQSFMESFMEDSCKSGFLAKLGRPSSDLQGHHVRDDSYVVGQRKGPKHGTEMR